jgi:phage pi2 protein 07
LFVDALEQKHMYLFRGIRSGIEGQTVHKNILVIHNLPRFFPQKILKINNNGVFFIMRDKWSGKWYTIANKKDKYIDKKYGTFSLKFDRYYNLPI